MVRTPFSKQSYLRARRTQTATASREALAVASHDRVSPVPEACTSADARLRDAARELGSRLHVELPERLPQVILDGARADEELRGDLPVRVSLGDEA